MADDNGIFKFERANFDRANDGGVETINIMDYWHIILRQKKYVIFVTIILLAIGLPIIYTLTPIYQSTAKVVVDSGQSKLVGLDIETGGGSALDYKVNTEVEIIKSNKVSLRTIKTLQLWNSLDYNGLSLSEKLYTLFATKKVEKANSTFRNYVDLSGQEVMGYIKALSLNISVSRTRRTNVIEIKATSTSANRAADIANNITRSYLTEKVESKADSVRGAADILRNQLDKLAVEIQDYDHQRENFITEYADKITDPNARRELEQLRTAISAKVQDKLRKTLQLSQISRASITKDYSTLSSLSNDAQTGTLYTKYETINLQLRAASLSDESRFDLQTELSRIENNFQALAQKAQDNLNADILNTQSQIEQFQNNRINVFSEHNLPEDVQLSLYRLTEGIKTKRELYEVEAKKYSEVEQKIGILIPDVRVIATAFPAEDPIKPNKKLLAVGLVIFAVFAGLIIAIIRDKLIGGFTSSEQVQSVLGLRPISIIPNHDDADVKNVILNSPLSRFSESIRMLRVGLDNYKASAVTSPDKNDASHSHSRVIAITSTLPKEGKTTIALSLARSYALMNKKTILVDLDFRHPAVYARLGLSKVYGLQEFIRDDAALNTIGDIIVHEEETGLDIALAGVAQKMATDILIQSASLDAILEKFKSQYEVVIIDTPPVGLVVDTQIIAQKIDQLVYAIKHASTSQKNVLTGINFINRAADKLPMSVIITQQDDSQAAYYGMYGAQYSYYYNG